MRTPETVKVHNTLRDAATRHESPLAEVNSTSWTGKVAPPLATRWHELVDCPKRLKTEGPFLQQFLQLYQEPLVLDAAAGIGCESVWLTLLGHKVVSNEVCPELRGLANERARQSDVSLHVTAVDWRDLESKFGTARFDVVLLLGNSLCLLRNEDERAAVTSVLHRICKDKGTLIVDERNFEYIVSNGNEVVRGRFRYTGKVMYCGTSVTGMPVSVSEEDVRFAYMDSGSNEVIGTLDMYPFRKGELASLLGKAGFSTVQVYSDLQVGFQSDADFFTYVCNP